MITKVKPYEIIESVNLPPKQIISTLVKIVSQCRNVKRLFLRGELTQVNVFTEKKNLEKENDFLKEMSIPAVRNTLVVVEETSLNILQYTYTELIKVRLMEEVSLEDIYFCIYKIMN